jgi:hypothetical protein
MSYYRKFMDDDKLPTIFKQKWKKDTETTRNAYLDHLDDLYYADLITRASLRTPEQLHGKPPRHVLVVCSNCGIGAVESRVSDGWTQPHECPKCGRWIKPESHRAQNLLQGGIKY